MDFVERVGRCIPTKRMHSWLFLSMRLNDWASQAGIPGELKYSNFMNMGAMVSGPDGGRVAHKYPAVCAHTLRPSVQNALDSTRHVKHSLGLPMF